MQNSQHVLLLVSKYRWLVSDVGGDFVKLYSWCQHKEGAIGNEHVRWSSFVLAARPRLNKHKFARYNEIRVDCCQTDKSKEIEYNITRGRL